MKVQLALAVMVLGIAGAPLLAGDEDKKAAPKKEENFEFTVQGQILAADPPDKVRNIPCKVHAVKLKKDVPYVIDMVSTELDSYLRLEDSAGNQLAQDDDSGGNLNARIRFTPGKDDTFLIYASPLGGGEGAYTLSVKSVAQTPAKLLPLPAPAAMKPAEAKGQIAANDPIDETRNRPSKVHSVALKGGKTYVIDLMSTDFDSYLTLKDAKGKILAEDDDSGGNLNARIRYQATADGTFQIVATTFNGQLGAYTIRVTEE